MWNLNDSPKAFRVSVDSHVRGTTMSKLSANRNIFNAMEFVHNARKTSTHPNVVKLLKRVSARLQGQLIPWDELGEPRFDHLCR